MTFAVDFKSLCFSSQLFIPISHSYALQGPWSPKKIANPDYFLDEEPLANVGKVGGVAIEVWTMDNNYYFSNILVDQDPSVAEKARDQYWQPKQALEVSVSGSMNYSDKIRTCPVQVEWPYAPLGRA